MAAMTQTQRARLGDIAQSFGIAYGLSFFMSFGLRGDSFPPQWLSILMFGTSFGLIITLNSILVQPHIRFRSFLLTILGQAVMWGLTIFFSFGASIWQLAIYKGGRPFGRDTWEAVGRILFSPILLLSALGAIFIVVIISSCHQISRKLGPGVLWNWVRGYYHVPREEERIFMFLDMKDSTTLAEKLGNIKFSALVRDFFSDMTTPVVETQGEVSHYIGDEAVLTWRMEKGLKNAACLRCFFLMRKAISRRESYYLDKYGLVPEFKAGVHCGTVVSTEVGDIKSEIVFHGDVLNTAARIQGMCNGVDSDLLISGELAALLTVPKDLKLGSVGKHMLKGKEHEVEILWVRSEPS